MTKKELLNYAESLFGDYNCAQTVLLSMAKYYEMECDCLERISAPFGGGLAGTRISVCGAISGGLMFIGLKEEKSKATSVGQELIAFVENKYNHRCCDKILDIDFNDAQQVANEKAEKGKTICTPLILDICSWIAEKYDE